MTFVFISFCVSFLVVLWAGKILPRAIGGIARILHVSEFITAFILVAAATSLPELFVGVSSAIGGIPTLSLGNIFGANLANMSLILGVAVLFSGTLLGKEGRLSLQNFWLIFAIAFLPALLGIDGVLSRIDGAVLIAAFGLYIAKLFRDKQYFHKVLHNHNEPKGFHAAGHILHHSGQFLLGVAFLVGGSFTLIWAAREIIDVYFNSQFFLFGSIVLAFGTTLPELMFAIRAALSKQSGAVFGNALGSVSFNAAAVIGIVALIRPIHIVFSREVLLVGVALLVSFILFRIFVYAKKSLGRAEGLLFLLIYAAFLFLTLR